MMQQATFHLDHHVIMQDPRTGKSGKVHHEEAREKLVPRVKNCRSPRASSPNYNEQEALLDARSAEKRVLKNDLYHIKLPFPWKLHQLLEDVKSDGNEHIVSWLPGGKSFKIHNQPEFIEKIMGQYFRQSKFKSFTRQVR